MAVKGPKAEMKEQMPRSEPAVDSETDATGGGGCDDSSDEYSASERGPGRGLRNVDGGRRSSSGIRQDRGESASGGEELEGAGSDLASDADWASDEDLLIGDEEEFEEEGRFEGAVMHSEAESSSEGSVEEEVEDEDEEDEEGGKGEGNEGEEGEEDDECESFDDIDDIFAAFAEEEAGARVETKKSPLGDGVTEAKKRGLQKPGKETNEAEADALLLESLGQGCDGSSDDDAGDGSDEDKFQPRSLAAILAAAAEKNAREGEALSFSCVPSPGDSRGSGKRPAAKTDWREKEGPFFFLIVPHLIHIIKSGLSDVSRFFQPTFAALHSLGRLLHAASIDALLQVNSHSIANADEPLPTDTHTATDTSTETSTKKRSTDTPRKKRSTEADEREKYHFMQRIVLCAHRVSSIKGLANSAAEIDFDGFEEVLDFRPLSLQTPRMRVLFDRVAAAKSRQKVALLRVVAERLLALLQRKCAEDEAAATAFARAFKEARHVVSKDRSTRAARKATQVADGVKAANRRSKPKIKRRSLPS